MDFLKGVLPPLPKLPNLKKIRNWNGGSLLSLNHLPSLPSTFGLGSFMHSAAASAPPPQAPCSHPSISSGNSVLGTRSKEGGQRKRNAPNAHFRQHRRNPSDICIISTAVSSESPAEFNRRDNFGLYALKCDRSAAKHGILLNLPRKLTQAVVGDGGAAPISATADQHSAVDGALVHEKFSPCKRPAPGPDLTSGIHQQQHEAISIKPPPRRRKRSPLQARNLLDAERLPELNRWEKNSSELFRIVERESASAARARSAGGVGLVGWSRKPELPFAGPERPCDSIQTCLVGPPKARSVDNLLAMRCHRRARYDPREQRQSESDSESEAQQVRSLRVHPPPYPRRSSRNVTNASCGVKQAAPAAARKLHVHQRNESCPHSLGGGRSADQPNVGQQLLERSGASGEENAPAAPTPAAVAMLHYKLKQATDFSIENNSDEIEVRFRSQLCNEGDGIEHTMRPDERLPLPPRVTQLRCANSRSSVQAVGQPSVKTSIPATRHPNENVGIRAIRSGGAYDSVPKSAGLPTEQRQHQAQESEASGRTAKFVPLAEVLKQSIDCGELKRKWINEFLEESDAPVELTKKRIEETPVVVESRRHKEAAPLESFQHSTEGSVDIFRKHACDFGEFDELFSKAQEMRQMEKGGKIPNDEDRFCPAGAARKSVKLSEEVTYIERSSTTSNLCFSSSSFSFASVEDNDQREETGTDTADSISEPPLPPPPPPPPLPPISQLPAFKKETILNAPSITVPDQDKIAGTCKGSSSGSSCKSTVIIQDYSSKHLQRVRYLSSPSPSRSSTVGLPGENALYGSYNINSPKNSVKQDDHGDDRNNEDQYDHGGEYVGRANNNIVLPLTVIKNISPYDRNEVLLPSSSMQPDAFTCSKQQSTNEMHELNQNTFELTGGLMTTANGSVNAVRVTAESAGSTASRCQASTYISNPAKANPSATAAVDGYGAKRFINTRIEHIPYNRNNINSNCTNANITTVTSKPTTNMAVSNYYNNNRTKQTVMATLPNSIFIVGDAFDRSRDGEWRGLEYRHSRLHQSDDSVLPVVYHASPSALHATQAPQFCCTTEQLPNDPNESDTGTRRNTRTVVSAKETSGGVGASQFSVIPDYDEYYNEEGVVII